MRHTRGSLLKIGPNGEFVKKRDCLYYGGLDVSSCPCVLISHYGLCRLMCYIYTYEDYISLGGSVYRANNAEILATVKDNNLHINVKRQINVRRQIEEFLC